jgi:hypothetical protein
MLKVPALKVAVMLPWAMIPAPILYVALLPPLKVSVFDVLVSAKIVRRAGRGIGNGRVVPPVIELKLNERVPISVTVWADDAYTSVQSVGYGGVFTLLPENVTALPPLGKSRWASLWPRPC